MTKQLEELFLSEDDEDIELAFIIARKEGIDAHIFLRSNEYEESLYARMRYPIRMTLFDKYIQNDSGFKWIDNE